MNHTGMDSHGASEARSVPARLRVSVTPCETLHRAKAQRPQSLLGMDSHGATEARSVPACLRVSAPPCETLSPRSAERSALCRLADDERGVEENLAWWRLRVPQTLEHGDERRLRDFPVGLSHGRERRLGAGGEADVVDARHADVMRNPLAELLERVHQRDGRDVVGAEERVRRRRTAQKGGERVGVRRVGMAYADVRKVQPRVETRFASPLEAQRDGRCRVRLGQEADVPRPRRDEMRREAVADLDVVERDEIVGTALRRRNDVAVEKDDGDAVPVRWAVNRFCRISCGEV